MPVDIDLHDAIQRRFNDLLVVLRNTDTGNPPVLQDSPSGSSLRVNGTSDTVAPNNPWAPMNTLDEQTILLVEDDVKAREIATMILEAEGIHVYAAANASTALELFGMHPDLDLLISDINMPGSMNGIQLAQRIRHDDPSMRVVLVSGNPQSSFSDLPTDILFLPKPFDRRALLGAVQASLRS